MKRFYSLLAVLALLCGCAAAPAASPAPEEPEAAVPLTESLRAPAHYTFEAASETGVSRVSVDAAVHIPDAASAGILAAEPALFSGEEVRAFAERHEGDAPWRHALSWEPYCGEGLEEQALTGSLEGNTSYRLWLTAGDPAVSRLSIVCSYWLDETGRISYTPTLEYSCGESAAPGGLLPLNEDGGADGCAINAAQAELYAQSEVDALREGFTLARAGQLDRIAAKGRKYGLLFTREIGGIPVNPDAAHGVNDGGRFVSGTEVISVTVDDAGVCSLSYENPMQVGEVLEESAALLPFDEIAAIFEAVALLDIQPLEAAAAPEENILRVEEIRFGYMAVLQADGSYQYRPVWDFYGSYWPVYEGGAPAPDSLWEPVFTIDAVDGTVIDRWRGY